MKPITDFLRSRPAISARAIEREAGLPLNTLSNALSEATARPIPEQWIWPLCVTLARYGLDVDGWRFFYADDIHSFILNREGEGDEEPDRMLIDSPAELAEFLSR